MARFINEVQNYASADDSIYIAIGCDIDLTGLEFTSREHLFRVQLDNGDYALVNSVKLGFDGPCSREVRQSFLDFAILNDYRPPK